MKRVSLRADHVPKQSPVPQYRQKSRRYTNYQASIERLESRLPPGDLLLAGWLSAGLAEPSHVALDTGNGRVPAASGHVPPAVLAEPAGVVPPLSAGGPQHAVQGSERVEAGDSFDFRPWEIGAVFLPDLTADLDVFLSRAGPRLRAVPAGANESASAVMFPGQDGHVPRLQDGVTVAGFGAPAARVGTTSVGGADFAIGQLPPGAVENPPATLASDCSVSLEPATPSPHLVGERVEWIATAEGCGDTPVYQFSGGPADADPHVIRDYVPGSTFSWAPMEEGNYLIQVIVKESYDALDIAYAGVEEEVLPRATQDEAAVAPTANPMVALYSVPPCASETVRVEFRPFEDPDDDRWRSTDARACNAERTVNILVAGMRAEMAYELRHVTDEIASPSLLFTTGSPPADLRFPTYTVAQEPGDGTDLEHGTVFQMAIMLSFPVVNLLATDMQGRLEWFFDTTTSGLSQVAGSSLVRGGSVLLLGGYYNPGVGQEVLREVDLAGNLIRETNYKAINAQMAAMGLPLTNGFHHDAQRLPDGKTAVLAYIDGVVDLEGKPTTYVGDMVLVLDENFQVVWAWNGFDHLETGRGPVLGDRCSGGGCSSQDPNAIDWMHSNSVAWSPADRNLIISVRHQDWVVKINYDDGFGDGSVLWRLGNDGDFVIDSEDAYPWFSYQHDARYTDEGTLALYDNGNTRCRDKEECTSRGQVYLLDEGSLSAAHVLNADLGREAPAFGSAQRLPGGNYVFTSGNQGTFADPRGRSIETLPDGSLTYVLESAQSWLYRTYRLRSLYEKTP